MFINSKHDCYNATTIQTDEGVKQVRKLYSEICWCKEHYDAMDVIIRVTLNFKNYKLTTSSFLERF